MTAVPTKGPSLEVVLGMLLSRHPQHAAFIDKRFKNADGADLETCDQIASEILRIAGTRLADFCDGYDFICKIQKAEEVYFRRYDSYRLTRFDDANREVYSNKPYMEAYMRGLLMTQILWSNHTRSLDFYTNTFLTSVPSDGRFLEIGPGHGLLMARAIAKMNEGCVAGWDISEASLQDTSKALQSLGVTKTFHLQARNLFDAGTERFDAIVLSEVLEHLEEPERAVRAIAGILAEEGRFYINVPLNSPAPDHLFLIRSPAQLENFVDACGLRIVESGYYPATNYTMDQAVRHKLTVSACLICMHGRDKP